MRSPYEELTLTFGDAKVPYLYGIGRTAVDHDFEPEAETSDAARRPLFGRRIRARGAIVIGVVAGAMAVSGISAASENASPGDALYGVKRSTERAQLAMAGSDVTRGQLSLNFARNRLAEAAAMPGGAAGLGGVLNDMDADTRKGVKLLTTAAVARRDGKPLDTVDDFVARQRRTLSPMLEKAGPAGRQRTLNSLELLDAVHQRTGDLRAGLACTPVTAAGSDLLGPKLKNCAAHGDSPSTSRPAGHGGKTTPAKPGKGTAKVRPERSGHPTDEPDTDASAPAEDPAGTGTGTGTGPDLGPIGGVTPSPSGEPADGDQDDDGNVLGGILGGIFGAH